jgi:hypothetical protein
MHLAANIGTPLDGLDLLVFAVLAVVIVGAQIMRDRGERRREPPYDQDEDFEARQDTRAWESGRWDA